MPRAKIELVDLYQSKEQIKKECEDLEAKGYLLVNHILDDEFGYLEYEEITDSNKEEVTAKSKNYKAKVEKYRLAFNGAIHQQPRI